MKRSSLMGLIVGAMLLFIAGFLLAMNRGPEPRPESRIRASLQDAEEGARARNIRQVMDLISDDYKDPRGATKAKLRQGVTIAVQQSRGINWDVRVGVRQVTIDPADPDRATVIAAVEAFDKASNESIWGSGGQPLTIEFRRERGRRYLVLPDERWRVTSVSNLPGLPGMGSE